MSAYRQEVREFVRASEALLSPISIGGELLTQQEREIIQFYATSLSDYCNGLGDGSCLLSRPSGRPSIFRRLRPSPDDPLTTSAGGRTAG